MMSILFTIGTLAVIGTAGLALDLGLAYHTKTELQNALDAAALDGAKTLNQTFDTTLATSAAKTTFGNNMGALAGGLVPTVETSLTLDPFTPGSGTATNPPKYLRVKLLALPVAIRLALVLPGVANSLNVGGTAVAGPIVLGQYCGAFPVMLCGASTPTDCSDYSCYGLTGGPSTETVLANGTKSIGPGNYGFIEYNGCTGGSCLRDTLAGGNGNFCFSVGGTVTTEPGLSTGPAEQGFNTRFGVYNGPVSSATYPPDVVTTNNDTGTPSFFYGNYQAALEDPSIWNFPTTGVPGRRLVTVPVANCSTAINGRSSVTVVGAACFFLTRELLKSNNDAIYGQLLPSCGTGGTVNPTPSGSGPYKIVLYQDPGNARGT